MVVLEIIITGLITLPGEVGAVVVNFPALVSERYRMYDPVDPLIVDINELGSDISPEYTMEKSVAFIDSMTPKKFELF